MLHRHSWTEAREESLKGREGLLVANPDA